MGGRGASSVGSKKFSSMSDADDFFGVGNSSGMFPDWYDDTTDDEKESSIYYTSSAYIQINEHLREIKGKTLDNASDKIKQTVAGIDSAMKKFKLTQDITVFRGGSNALIGGATTLEAVKAMTGTIVMDKGIMSTAVTPAGMWSTTGGNVGYEIEIPKGVGRGIYIAPVSNFSSEQEFMVARGTQFKVMGGYKDTHGNVICKLKAIYPKQK